jgi:hypothetical protein
VTVTAKLAAVQGEWRMTPTTDPGGALAQMICECHVGGRVVAEGDLMFFGVSAASTLGSREEGVFEEIREMVAAG